MQIGGERDRDVRVPETRRAFTGYGVTVVDENGSKPLEQAELGEG
jgi:hypothetical protein